MPAYPTGTVTFLFTDIESSTPLAALMGERYGDVLEQHFVILRGAVRSHGGVEFGTEGDAQFVAFERARDATAAAIAAQHALVTHDWPEEGVVRVRIGIHTGEPIVRQDGYDGIEVIRAARIEDAAHGSQILLSQTTAALAVGALPEDAGLIDLGEHRLKGLPRPERLFQLKAPGLPRDFPPPRSLDHYLNNLPAISHNMLGREEEQKAALDFISQCQRKVLTITGPSGVGKTTTAIAVANVARSQFPNGVCFVDLAPIADADVVPETIGRTFGFPSRPHGIDSEAVVRYLRDRRLLLVLDNFEHVIESAPFVARIVSECPGVQVVVTSRERMNLPTEQLLPLAGLATPPAEVASRALALRSPAVQLFIDRASAVDPTFTPSSDDLLAISEIVNRLDGLPLAIQLAASRVRTLRPVAMLPRLKRRLALLTGAARGRPERHLDLRTAIAWSYDVLELSEQRLLRWLSVFRASFSLEAVETTLESMGADPYEGLNLVEALVDKSLLVRFDSDSGEPRFDMLETIREFAGEECDSLAETELAQKAMLQYFVDFVRRLEPRLLHAGQPDGLATVAVEIDNLRAALEVAAATDPSAGIEIASILNPFWFETNHREGRDWLIRLLRLTPDCADVLWMRGIVVANRLSNTRAEVQEVLPDLERCVKICREGQRRFWLATSLNNLAHALLMLEEPDSALPAAVEAVEIARVVAQRGPAMTSVLISSLGVLASARALAGDLDGADSAASESIDIARRGGDAQQMTLGLALMAELEFNRGRADRAYRCYAEALEIHSRVGGGYGTTECLAGMARAELARRHLLDAEIYARRALEARKVNPNSFELAWALSALALVSRERDGSEQCVQLFAAAASVGGDAGRLRQSLHAVSDAAVLDNLRELMDPDDFESAWAFGQQLTADQAIQFAMEVLGQNTAEQD